MSQGANVFISKKVQKTVETNNPSFDLGLIVGQYSSERYYALDILKCHLHSEVEFYDETSLRDNLKDVRNMLPGGMNIIGIVAKKDFENSSKMTLPDALSMALSYFGSYPSSYDVDPMYAPIYMELGTNECFYCNKYRKFIKLTHKELSSDFRLFYFTTHIYLKINSSSETKITTENTFRDIILSISPWLKTVRSSKLVYRNDFKPYTIKPTDETISDDAFELVVENSCPDNAGISYKEIKGAVAINGYIACRPCFSNAISDLHTYIENALKEDLFRSINARISLISMECIVSGMLQLSEWSIFSPLRVEISLQDNEMPIKLTDYILDESIDNISERLFPFTGSKLQPGQLEYLEQLPGKSDISGLMNGINEASQSNDQPLYSSQFFQIMLSPVNSKHFLILVLSLLILLFGVAYRYNNQ